MHGDAVAGRPGCSGYGAEFESGLGPDVTIDFSALLLFLTLLLLVVWAGERLVWGRNRPQDQPRPWPVDFAASWLPLLALILILRSFLFEPFRIPSSSMEPTLLPGDFIAVNKYRHGLRFPFFGWAISQGLPLARGDVLVFRHPQGGRYFIKRVVGLPGDQLRYENKQLYINGEPVPRRLEAHLRGPGLSRYQERLDQGWHSLYLTTAAPATNVVAEVRPGHYFVMGDHRDNSWDSRSWGQVPHSLIVGRAEFLWMSWRGWSTSPQPMPSRATPRWRISIRV